MSLCVPEKMSEKSSNFEIIEAEDRNFSLGSSGINENALKNPAFVYLTSLGSKFSRNGMKNALLRFAKFLAFKIWKPFLGKELTLLPSTFIKLSC